MTLALETTSAHGSLALLQEDVVLMERALSARHYASELFGAVAAALREHQLGLNDVDLFAVADGPGSFTGVRIGLTAVKGWVEVLGRPAVAVSTLRAVAGLGTAPVIAALDASRGEVYYGVYPQGAKAPEAAGVEEGMESQASFAARCERAGWPRRTPHAVVREACPGLEAAPLLLAGAVGRLGLEDFRRGRRQTALELDARYIRRPDAEMA